jgi:hypothetical protein
MPRGGKRAGAGKPKGYRAPHTLDKIAARELVRQKVTAALEPMLRSQIAHAIGIGHLYTRDKNGKFTKIESQALVDELLTTGTENKDYWIFTKDPSVQSFTDLLNRALDKPTDVVEMKHSANAEQLLAVLDAWKTKNRREPA